MNQTIVIEISTLAQPLSEQLKGLLDVDQINLFDADAKAIERLHVRSLITDLNYTLIREKLCRQISTAISRYAGCDGLEIVDAIDDAIDDDEDVVELVDAIDDAIDDGCDEDVELVDAIEDAIDA